MKNVTIIFWVLGVVLVIGLGILFLAKPAVAPAIEEAEEGIACTMDAMQCPDGSFVGRSGSNCEFVCPDIEEVSANAEIQIASPGAGDVVASPLQLSGQAIGPWYFEASLPVELRDWQGNVVATSYVTAQGDWMTVDAVPFTGQITFTSPYTPGNPDVMKQGSIVFKKDNPSALPENNGQVVVPVVFAN